SAVGSTNVSSTSATITWTTNEASDSQVEYGLTTSYGTQTTINSSLVTSHSQNLSGLSANTTYNYRVKSRDAGGNLTASQNFAFTTAPISAPGGGGGGSGVSSSGGTPPGQGLVAPTILYSIPSNGAQS